MTAQLAKHTVEVADLRAFIESQRALAYAERRALEASDTRMQHSLTAERLEFERDFDAAKRLRRRAPSPARNGSE